MLDIVFPFAGGLGLFLIGMMLLSEGLVAFGGSAMKRTDVFRAMDRMGSHVWRACHYLSQGRADGLAKPEAPPAPA